MITAHKMFVKKCKYLRKYFAKYAHKIFHNNYILLLNMLTK